MPPGSRHPWIYAKMLVHPRRRPPPGAVVEVVDPRGGFVGRGLYHPDRTIAVRVLTRDPTEAVDAGLVRRRLERAKALRTELLALDRDTDAYRVVHAEGDGLSGLVIDRYADVCLVEPLAAGWRDLGRAVAESLVALYPGSRVAFRPDKKLEQQEGVSFAALARDFPAGPGATITEHGLRMQVDFATGHKTGYFTDQRDNRQRVALLAKGRTVLDLCCYTGGFAIACARAGARAVTAVDLDEKALVVAARNARTNEVAVDFLHRNAFDFLRESVAAGKTWDVVVVDPAKLAAVKDEISRALKTYDDLNALALRVTASGGVAASFSCSGLVSESKFLSVLANAAYGAGVEHQAFHVGGAGGDHPVLAEFPEGRYLKAVFARVFR